MFMGYCIVIADRIVRQIGDRNLLEFTNREKNGLGLDERGDKNDENGQNPFDPDKIMG